MWELDAAALAQRYRLANFGEAGGVLLDGSSGALCRLNATACRLVEGLLAGEEVARIAATQAQQAGASTERVRADLQSLAATLEQAPPAESRMPVAPAAQVRLQLTQGASGARLALFVRGTIALYWWPATGEIAPGPGKVELGHALRLLVPHIATYYGQAVLHAAALGCSAAASGESALVWLGESGAGKSTVVALAAELGIGWVCAEDVSVMIPAPSGEGLALERHGEARLHAYSAQLAGELTTVPPEERRQVPPLPSPKPMQPSPVLDRLVLLSREQRHEHAHIERRQLTGPDALLAVLPHTFAELDTPDVRRHAFQIAATVARHTPVERWHVPNTLEALRTALARFATHGLE